MNKNQLLGILGAILLFIGAFCPFMSLPIVGQVNYFHNGQSDGIIIVGIAALSLFFSFLPKKEYQLIPALAALGTIAYDIYTIKQKVALLTDENSDNYSSIGSTIAQSVQIEWGVAIMIVGIVMLIAAAFISNE